MRLKSNILKSYMAIAIAFSGFQSFAQTKSKPNVIVIYTDDQGAIDLGSYGANDIYSPNIDKLAKEGTRFTQAYVAAPVCAPSRAALLTGRYPQNAELTGNTSAEPGSDGLPAEQYTLAELFKDNGYATGHVGKWHLGMSQTSSPNAQGFDYSFGHLRGCIDNYSHFFYWEGPNIHDLYENGKEVFYDGQYFPDLASDKAINYVENHKNEPFFMYYAINMPHYPYQPTQKWREYYKNMAKPRADYAAFISTIDERIGFLMDKLDELGIRENTIVIYQSDNGYSTETRAFGGGGNAGPYRGAKSSLFEGGIRLPTIISWKNNLPENVVNDQFLMNIDWMPTLAKLCKLDKINTKIDGIDLSKMIENPKKTTERTSGFWKYGKQWVVRKGNWKLIGFPKDTSNKGELNLEEDALFLSNLDEDVSEMVNLASKYPEKVKELTQEFLAWEHGHEKDIPKKIETVSNLAKGGKISATTTVNQKYSDLNLLIDGKLGYTDYASGQWIGQEGKSMEFVIDLNKIKPIKTISVNSLNNSGNWIFPVQAVEIRLSDDGKTYGGLKTIKRDTKQPKTENATERLTLNIGEDSRFIKIKVEGIGNCPKGHPGAGFPGWFFVDEIIIE
ncbi:sulfatase-like hydrolase/transferase [Aestuariibaculum sediminum]|uniref:Sulfatase-like hydrolase/transferase n=1 Tax=Aestuariibaculum sediminum TaxID=2770637 RepID=A0A8J6U8Y9_9FLAO|nr:sulfatase-like hydrolase/transferase [Aestuariibaculum sediminum]MBD0832322.1 sulfatase-like hydrolase/transferase [Aestuariibaculum sediminum]